jgi:hypothetical protein
MHMQKLIQCCLGSLLISTVTCSQSLDQMITPAAVESVERVLSSDDMQGRAVNTPGIEKAADFISREFKAAGLVSFVPGGGYRQEFIMVQPKLLDISGLLDGQPMDPGKLSLLSSKKEVTISSANAFRKKTIKAGENFFQAVLGCVRGKEDLLVLVDPSFAAQFARLSYFREHQFQSDRTLVFLLTDKEPASYSIHARQEISEIRMSNIVGIIPGKEKKEEKVIFSAHYDHLGTHSTPGQTDSIFNGANDDASGVTAVITLANYFQKVRNNARTLVFVAFTAEEIGEWGSAYFAEQIDPDKVAAMVNIEMIGTESKWGPNTAFITGFERSDMGKIMQANLEGSSFRLYPDPYPQQNLFFRSDNASLARLGVPAHTISTSKMDSEKHYHTVSDEIGTLDLKNMTAIIKAIAIGASSIVVGTNQPSRVAASSR